MGERVLKVQLGELRTIRLKYADGTVTELPIEQLEHYAAGAKSRGRITEREDRMLVNLRTAIAELLVSQPDKKISDVEFILPVPDCPSS
jgi:hypothetical protein